MKDCSMIERMRTYVLKDRYGLFAIYAVVLLLLGLVGALYVIIFLGENPYSYSLGNAYRSNLETLPKPDSIFVKTSYFVSIGFVVAAMIRTSSLSISRSFLVGALVSMILMLALYRDPSDTQLKVIRVYHGTCNALSNEMHIHGLNVDDYSFLRMSNLIRYSRHLCD